MDSISTSDTILELKDIGLEFNLDLHGSYTFRDVFVRSLINPSSLFFRRKFDVLKKINFTLKKGDRVGLIGMNGCGKTTLCRLIAGMYTPKYGQKIVNGEVRAIFDINIGITPELTGKENAMILTELIFPNCKNKKEMVEDAIEFAELGDFINVPFYRYSKGMKTRLCLSLISSTPSDLLILDEVYSGADAYFLKKISKRILHMIENSGAVIFVSHSAAEIQEVCNKAVVIEYGEIIKIGDPKECIDFYNKKICHIET